MTEIPKVPQKHFRFHWKIQLFTEWPHNRILFRGFWLSLIFVLKFFFSCFFSLFSLLAFSDSSYFIRRLAIFKIFTDIIHQQLKYTRTVSRQLLISNSGLFSVIFKIHSEFEISISVLNGKRKKNEKLWKISIVLRGANRRLWRYISNKHEHYF